MEHSTTPILELSGPEPLVSIIMPTYNAARFIGASVQSVLNQTYSNWELVIVDDASADNTAEVVAAFKNDARIQYHRVERIGHPAGVRNTGLRLAKGDLIAFLDSDDLYFANTLEKLSRPLLKNTRLSAVYGFAFSVDENGQTLPQAIKLLERPADAVGENEPPYQLPPDYNNSWDAIVTSRITCMLPGLMLRRSAWEQIGFFNEDLCGPEDYEFYIRMYLHDYEGVYCLSDYVYQYRVHAASLTKAPEHCEKLLTSNLKIMRWLFNEAPIPSYLKAHQSRAHVACYRYLSRERLIHRQPALARKIAMMALRDRHIAFKDFVSQCVPLLVRSFLPGDFDQFLIALRRAWTNRLYKPFDWTVQAQNPVVQS